MKYPFLLFLILLVGCSTNKSDEKTKTNKNDLLDNIFVIPKNGIHADTLVFKKNGILEYIHTGIGVNFNSKYEFANDRIIISIFDFKNQYQADSEKEMVFQFELKMDKSDGFVCRVVRENSLFDKVRLNVVVGKVKE